MKKKNKSILRKTLQVLGLVLGIGAVGIGGYYGVDYIKSKQSSTENKIEVTDEKDRTILDLQTLNAQYRNQIYELEEQITTKNANIATLNSERLNAISEANELNEQLINVNSQLTQKITALENANNTIGTLISDKASLQASIEELTTLKQSLQAQIAELQEDITDKNAEISAKQEQLLLATASIEELQAEINAKIAIINTLTADKEALESEVEELTADKEDLQAQITSKQNQIVELSSTLETKFAEIETANANIVELQAEIVTNNETITTLTSDKENLQEEVESITEQLNSVNSQLEDKVSALETANATIETITATNNELQSSIATLTEVKAGLEDELEEAQSDLEELQSEYNTLDEASTQEKADLQAQINTKEETITQLNASINEKNAQIESLQGQITENLETIANLTLQLATSNEVVADVQAFIDYITSEEEVEEPTLTSESVQQLYDLCMQAMAEAENEISTLTAEVTRLNGVINEKEAEINTKANTITQLNASIDEKNAQIENLQGQITANLEAIATLTSQLATSNEVVADVQAFIEYITSEEEIEEPTLTSESVQQLYDLCMQAMAEAETEISTHTAEVTRLNGVINEKEAEIASLNNTVSGLQSTISGYSDTITSLNNQIDGLNSQIEQLTLDKTSLQEEVNTKAQTINGLNDSITSLNAQIVTLNETITSKETTIEGLNDTITQLEILQTELESDLSSANDIITTLNTQIEELQTEVNAKETTIYNLNLTINELQASNEHRVTIDNQFRLDVAISVAGLCIFNSVDDIISLHYDYYTSVEDDYAVIDSLTCASGYYFSPQIYTIDGKLIINASSNVEVNIIFDEITELDLDYNWRAPGEAFYDRLNGYGYTLTDIILSIMDIYISDSSCYAEISAEFVVEKNYDNLKFDGNELVSYTAEVSGVVDSEVIIPSWYSLREEYIYRDVSTSNEFLQFAKDTNFNFSCSYCTCNNYEDFLSFLNLPLDLAEENLETEFYAHFDNIELPLLMSGYIYKAIPGNEYVVLSIGEDVFNNCTNITTVIMKSATPPTISNTLFQGCTNLQAIYVPSGSLSAYQSAYGWSSYANLIVESVND